MCAMDEEYSEFVSFIDKKSEYIFHHYKITKGWINDIPILLILCDVGKVSAALAVEHIVAKEKIEFILVAGVAGSLDDRLQIGDIVLVDRAVSHDCWHPLFMNYWDNHLASWGSRVFQTDALLLNTLSKVLRGCEPEFADWMTRITKRKSSRIDIGAIATGDMAVFSKDKITQGLLDVFPAKCVDMETAAIFQAASLRNIPCAAVRCISDVADDHRPLFAALRYVEPLCQHLASFLSHNISGLMEEYSKAKRDTRSLYRFI